MVEWWGDVEWMSATHHLPRPWVASGGFQVEESNHIYPLVMTNIAIENHHF